MITMQVTGISNEQDFITGQSLFILILNRKIRIPIPENLASEILHEMYKEDSVEATPEEIPASDETNEDDDGIDQI